MELENARQALDAIAASRSELGTGRRDPWWMHLFGAGLMALIVAGIGFGGMIGTLAALSVTFAAVWKLVYDKRRSGIALDTFKFRQGRVFLGLALLFFVPLAICQARVQQTGGPDWLLTANAVAAGIAGAVLSILAGRMKRKVLVEAAR